MTIDDKVVQEGMSRRDFLRLVGLALAAAAVNPLSFGTARADEAKNIIIIDGERYDTNYVERLMQQYKAEDGRLYVKEFFKDRNIKLTTKGSYEEEVHNNDKPVLVMPFYSAEGARKINKINDADMREAIILDFLKKQFKDKIDVYGFEVYYNPATDESDEAFDLFFSEIRKFLYDHIGIKEVKESTIITKNGKKYLNIIAEAPSLLLYAARDGPKKLDEIQLIDVFRGGPVEEAFMYAVDFFINKWIPTNIYGKTENGKIWKFYNTSDERLVVPEK